MEMQSRIKRLFLEVEMYHGSSEVYDDSKKGLIYWVTDSKELALDYARGSIVHRKAGKVPLVYSVDVNVHNPAPIVNEYSRITRLLSDWYESSPNKSTVDKKLLLSIRDEIVAYWQSIGLDNSNIEVYKHWNMSDIEGNQLLVKYLKLLGYDSIYFNERGHDTYGVFDVGIVNQID
jgi:hypothetical protein